MVVRMVGNTHRANCGNAQRPGCVCTGCGGSLHGYQGWLTLACETPGERAELRQDLQSSVTLDPRSGNPRSNAVNRLACLSLARLDIADYLWRDADGEPKLSVVTSSVSDDSNEIAYVTVFARTLMEDTWPDISKMIDNTIGDNSTATAIKKRMANHMWCSLLVVLIQTIERIDKSLEVLSDKTKQLVRNTVGKHFESEFAKTVADAVVNIVVDKFWAALTQLLQTHFPILGAKSLRALRILTVFACPAIEQHRDVYEHAVMPLQDDGHELVTEKVKTWMTVLFRAWWHKRALTPA
jgi:hypothetical protein